MIKFVVPSVAVGEAVGDIELKDEVFGIENVSEFAVHEVIKNYLSQCVDYTLKMQIDENGDKLELNVKVIDSK